MKSSISVDFVKKNMKYPSSFHFFNEFQTIDRYRPNGSEIEDSSRNIVKEIRSLLLAVRKGVIVCRYEYCTIMFDFSRDDTDRYTVMFSSAVNEKGYH